MIRVIQFWNSIVKEGKPLSIRTLSFGGIGLLVCIIIALIDQLFGLNISAFLLFGLAFSLAAILYIEFKGYKRFVNAAFVLTINSFLMAIVFVEGLAAGSHLYILALLVALSFLMGDTNENKIEVLVYFLIQISAFCGCLFYGKMTTDLQKFSEGLYHIKFLINSISSAILIATFAYVGMFFERQAKEALVIERNKAMAQAEMINEQNNYLKEIAFISAHTVRAPLVNILSLTNMMINNDNYSEKDKKLLAFLKIATHELDAAVHQMVDKTLIADSTTNNTK